MATAAHDVPIREEDRHWRVSPQLVARLARPRWAWLGIGLMAVGLVLIYLLVTAWPAIVDASQQAQRPHAIHWFGGSFTPTLDSALLLLVVLVSALGSYVHAATSFADYYGNRKLHASWLWWYLLRVFIGCSLALLFYFALRGGFFSAGSSSKDVNPYGIAALAGLVGLFSKQATDKLRELFDTAFRVRAGDGDDARADSIVNPKPVLVAVEPPRLTADTIDLVLRGSGFTAESVVRVLQPNGDTVPRQATFRDASTLSLRLEQADVSAPGLVRLSVHTPPPGGGTTDPIQVEVVEPADGAGSGS